MAKHSKQAGMHELPSGLTHFADSLSGGVRGTFIDKFGPPAAPTERYATSNGGTSHKAPDLHKKFFGKGGK